MKKKTKIIILISVCILITIIGIYFLFPKGNSGLVCGDDESCRHHVRHTDHVSGFAKEFIVKHLNRTATISRGYGAFSGKCVTVIMSVLSRREAVQLRRYAREVDPGAFITIVDSSEIVGKGFRGTN